MIIIIITYYNVYLKLDRYYFGQNKRDDEIFNEEVRGLNYFVSHAYFNHCSLFNNLT